MKNIHSLYRARAGAFGAYRGERSKHAKLNRSQVREIRARYTAGDRGGEFASVYGITPAHFNAIGRRRVWGWLD